MAFVAFLWTRRINPTARGELPRAKKWNYVNTHCRTPESVSCVSLIIWATLRLGTAYIPISSRAHVYACVCVCVDSGTGRQKHNWQLAFGSQRREGERKEGRHPGVEEVSDDSCIAEIYLTHRTIWTVSVLHHTKPTQVKSLAQIREHSHSTCRKIN